MLEVIWDKDLICGASGHEALIHNQQVIEIIGHSIEIVMDDEDVRATIGEGTQLLHDQSLAWTIDAHERFIQEHELRVLHNGAGEEDSLELATRQFGDVPTVKFPHVDCLECLLGGSSMRGSGATQQTERWIGTHQDGVQHIGGEVHVQI